MSIYCSFLIVNPKDLKLVKSICTSNEWEIRLCPDPSKRFWFGEYDVYSITKPIALGTQQSDHTPGQLIAIEAEENIANNVIQLLYASHNIINGNPSERIDLLEGFKLPKEPDEQEILYKNIFQTKGYFESFYYHPEIPVALFMTNAAWLDPSIIYAIHKLAHSFATESITYWSAHPRYGAILDNSSCLYSDHVNTSAAINFAFSAIEELQLQIKSSSKHKRWLDKNTVEWNPVVLKDIEHRLEQAGIDPKQKISWIIRGNDLSATSLVEPTLGKLKPYSNEQVVKDIELTLPEALHISSYLRNFMTAHRLSENSALLGPYEVHNVQSLARLLILSKCGVWNTWTNELTKTYESHN